MNSEVGLRLLLCPLGSNIVVRTASCSIGVVLPVYSTFKAIERRDQEEQKKWLMYWAAYGSFSMVEMFTDKLLNCYILFLLSCLISHCIYFFSFLALICCHLNFNIIRFPLYYHTKFAFLVWLQLPSIDGAKQVYMNHLRPFLLGHQAKLDQIVGFVYGEMSRFVSQHLEEVMFVKTILMKILASGEDNTRPEQRQASAAIEGPNREDDSESEYDD